MPLSTHPLPLIEPALPALARWLLDRSEAGCPEAMASMLVLLPSHRAGGQLGHALLEAAGGSALILPRILTPDRLAEHLRALQDETDPGELPDPALRPLVLAPHLARLDWLQDRPEAAPGLAADLIDLFDELRLARQDDLVLGGDRDEDLLQRLEPGAAEVLRIDLQRLRSAWHIYRQVLPQDQIDRRRDAFDRAGQSWPGTLPTLLAAAHLGRLDQVLADLLRALSDQGVPVHWLTAGAQGPRSRLLLATYRDLEAPVSPLHGIRQLAARLGAELPLPPVAVGADLASRLDTLEAERQQLGSDGPVRLQSCRDGEHESRVVAEMVCEFLAEAAGQPAADGPAPAGTPTVLVATADRDLAARIAAQLRDAGIDVDDSRGRPLANLPAGRLLRDLLRSVSGGWALTPLLEVLRHPYVRLVPRGTRPEHAVRAQLLEAAIRRARTARRSLQTLAMIAAADDQSAGQTRQAWSLQALVDELATGLQPLDALISGPVRWESVLDALESVWSALAPDRPLDAEPDPRHDHDDIGGVLTLLESLRQAVAWLEPAPLNAIAAAITDLLTGPTCEVRPLRQRALPVRLVGLVEARLESADLLVLAGMGQDTFPGRLVRPLFLPDHLRRQLGLKHWRRQSGDSAELFLRLLHIAPQIRITWPRERDGRPALPSPLVQRLILAAGVEPASAPEPRLRRREVPDTVRLADAEVRHRAEPEPVPAPLIAPREPLSHSAIQIYRECPYRFLMASSLRLRRPDPLEAAYSPADVGTLAHRVMQRWLDPGGPGWEALARGDGPAAEAQLRAAALQVAGRQDTGDPAARSVAVQQQLPGAAVALQSLLCLAPDLVAIELERAGAWQPAVLEGEFSLTVAEAARWLDEADPGAPALIIPDAHREVRLTGSIDRIDRRRDGAAQAAVIDYKTGVLPSKASISDGRLLQLHLYALAVEVGAVRELTAPPGSAWRLDHAGFYGLRRQGLGLPTQPHLTSGADFIAGVRTILQQVLAILDPRSPYALVPDWQAEQGSGQLPCRTCEFRGVCRLEERDHGPALAARLAALLTESPRGVS